MSFKKGEKVRCIDAAECLYIKEGKVYAATGNASVSAGTVEIIDDRGKASWYYPDRFEVVEDEPKAAEPMPKLTLQLENGIGITLDPNLPLSRKFADVFLDIVYGKG